MSHQASRECSSLVTQFLKQLIELVKSKARLPNYGSQCSFGQFVMIRNDNPSMRIMRLSQHNMAPSLMILVIAEFGQCFNNVPARDLRQSCQIGTSTSSSAMGGGIGSSCAAKLPR
jgi:hypothetical protein